MRAGGAAKRTAVGKGNAAAQNDAIGDGKAPAAKAERSTLAAIAQTRPQLFPLEIRADYRGATIKALINTAGEIEYNGKTYKSPSAAANAARLDHGFGGAVRVRTNGWTWWLFVDVDGTRKELDVLRRGSQAPASIQHGDLSGARD